MVWLLVRVFLYGYFSSVIMLYIVLDFSHQYSELNIIGPSEITYQYAIYGAVAAVVSTLSYQGLKRVIVILWESD